MSNIPRQSNSAKSTGADRLQPALQLFISHYSMLNFAGHKTPVQDFPVEGFCSIYQSNQKAQRNINLSGWRCGAQTAVVAGSLTVH
jgi:hypothetical protein